MNNTVNDSFIMTTSSVTPSVTNVANQGTRPRNVQSVTKDLEMKQRTGYPITIAADFLQPTSQRYLYLMSLTLLLMLHSLPQTMRSLLDAMRLLPWR
jgi:hypothetical protein